MAMLHKSKKKLSFEVRIKSYWGGNSGEHNKDKHIKFFTETKDKDILENIGVQIKEYKNFSIYFNSNDKQNNNKLIINKPYGDEEDIFVEHGEQKKLNYDGLSWPPDEYIITAKVSDREYYSLIKITPKTVTKKQLKKMRNQVNNLIKDIIYNIGRPKKIDLNLLESNMLYKSDIHLLDQISDNFQLLRNMLTDILRKPIQTLQKNYKIKNDKFKLDKRSVKWLSSKKGRSLNNFTEYPEQLYQENLIYSLENTENKWLIKIIDYIRRQLHKIERALEKELAEKKAELNNITKNINISKEKLKRINNHRNSYQYKERKYELKKRIKGKILEKEKCEEYINIIDKNLKKARKLTNQMGLLFSKEIYISNKDFLKAKAPTKNLLRDKRYKFFYDFYKKIMKLKSDEEFKGKRYEYKETSKLYEYYVLVNIIRALIELEFNFTEKSSFKERIESHSILELSEGTIISLKGDDKYIEIHYDEELCWNDEKKAKRPNYEFTTSAGCLKPDFRIDIYKQDSEKKYEYLSSFIVEVKYRRFSKIYNPEIENPVYKKLTDYNDKIKILPGHEDAVDKVLVTYPEDPHYSKVIKSIQGGSIKFIQLSPDNKKEEQFGYGVFLNEIEKMVR